jgi:hypothetical protein
LNPSLETRAQHASSFFDGRYSVSLPSCLQRWQHVMRPRCREATLRKLPA